MAFSEVKRERGRKKITLPSGDTIYIPVIISLTVRDQNGQETEHHYLNTNDALQREVHIDHLTPSVVDNDGNATSDPGVAAGTETIDIERIDTWIGLDAIEQAQESQFLLDNTSGNDTHPPRFTTHVKTHVYRYFKNPTSPDNDGIWVDSELIDEIAVVDQNGQEWQYFLDNPFNEDTHNGDFSGQANSDDPDITAESGLDPPYRTDPFQNIVNFNHSPWILFGIEIAGGDTGTGSGLGFPPQAIGSSVYSFTYLTGWEMHRASPDSSGTFMLGGETYNYSGVPSVSESGSFSAWTVCGFDIPEVPFSGLAVAVRAQAEGTGIGPYLGYPNATHPEPGWVDTLSVTADFLAWNGTGPFNVFGNVGGPQTPGMITNATQAQFTADWLNAFPGAPNRSIYEYGDVGGSTSIDLSGITITKGSATWLPVAIKLGSIGPLRDGFTIDNASFGGITVLMKRQ